MCQDCGLYFVGIVSFCPLKKKEPGTVFIFSFTEEEIEAW